jgi:ABC-type transporter Mla maintaining outer membrane lipid asymmetry ATPase subunit MlaF
VCTCLLARNLYLFDEPLAGVDSTNAPIVAAAISSLVPSWPNPADGAKTLTALTAEQRRARALRTVIVVTHSDEQAALFPGANVLTLERG